MKTKLGLNIKIPKVIDIQDNQEVNFISPTKIIKNQCTNIIDDIYVSGYQYSLDYEFLNKNNFTHIINCAVRSKRFTSGFFEEFKYLTLDVKDDPSFDLINSIKSVIEFIETATLENPKRKILIHCFEGVSRAPTMLCAYIMWKYKYDKDTAIQFVKEKRSCVEINLGFLFQLDSLRESLSDSMNVTTTIEIPTISI